MAFTPLGLSGILFPTGGGEFNSPDLILYLRVQVMLYFSNIFGPIEDIAEPATLDVEFGDGTPDYHVSGLTRAQIQLGVPVPHIYPFPPMLNGEYDFDLTATVHAGGNIGIFKLPTMRVHHGAPPGPGGGVVPPLRRGQRSDGKGPTGHARLDQVTTDAPRVGNKSRLI